MGKATREEAELKDNYWWVAIAALHIGGARQHGPGSPSPAAGAVKEKQVTSVLLRSLTCWPPCLQQ